VVDDRSYRGKNGFNYRIDQEHHNGFWQNVSRLFMEPQHQQRMQDEHTLWLYARETGDALAYEWRPVLRSSPNYLDELCQAMADANDIRMFYSGYGTNLPVHFGQMIAAIRRRNITSLPVKPDDTLQELI